MSAEPSVTLYRIENPNIPAKPGGATSHPDLVGQWFSPNPEKTALYLRKSTQTFGRDAKPVEGARLVVASIPGGKQEEYHVSRHPIASGMDVEDDNYLIPRDGSVDIVEIPLDPIIEDLKMRLGNVEALLEAQRRIRNLTEELGYSAIA